MTRHIAALEKHRNLPPLYRGHRRFQLTAAVEIYLESVIKSLDELEQGALRMSGEASIVTKVMILAMPSFASRSRIPRLKHPSVIQLEIEIKFATSIWDTDYRNERFDLAIHYSDGAWPGAKPLMHNELVPVAASSLLHELKPGSIDALACAPWLHDAPRASKWSQWLAAANAVGISSARNIKLQGTDATRVAAVAGLGVAIGHGALVEHEVREGRLAIAWPYRAPLAAGYHLIQSKRGLSNLASRFIAGWLVDEAAIFRNAAGH